MPLPLELRSRPAGTARGLIGRCCSHVPRAYFRHGAPVTVSASASRPAIQLSSKLPRPQRFFASRRQAVKVQAVFERFTERSIKTVMIAQTEAKAFGHSEVNTEHILLGLIAEESVSKNGYLNSGVSSERAKEAVANTFGRKRPISHGESIPFSREVRKMFEAATHECKRTNVNWISPEHILLAMLAMPDCNGKRVLTSIAADPDYLRTEAARRLKGDSDTEAANKKKQSPAREGPKMSEEYCRDLCAEVRGGRIDPVVGREREVSRLIQILARRTKNNPILLGEPGVGKTAIAEGLAAAIVARAPSVLDGSPLPEFLAAKRILQLDVGLLIAGAKERGELESRVTRLIAEVKEAGNIILMIDEIHTLVGAGSVGRGGGGGGGGLDIANLIKPALARGEFQVIGATTLDEHRKHIERDPALERRFQPVTVGEPSPEASLAILKGLKERYERHHRVAYSEEALAAAVALSHKYIADRFLPDKAIDLLDEAGSRARITAYTARQEQVQQAAVAVAAATRQQGQGQAGVAAATGESSSSATNYYAAEGVGAVTQVPTAAAAGGVAVASRDHPRLNEYLQVLAAKDEAVKDGHYEEALILARRQADYRDEMAGPSSSGSILPVVGAEDIEAIVAAWTGIPVEKMAEDERERLVNLRSTLSSSVVGQEDAVESISSALCRARCGLKDPRRPVAALLFVGPTGVGKTELAKVLADQYYGSRDCLLRLDMSEYMERHAVSKLIGAPPGYVGFGEGGKLTEAIRRRPFSVVLFDEVEKAHPDVFSVLLQILEDGRLTDSQGRTVSFKNALIILTSNIGSRVIAAGGGSGGMSRAGVFSRAAAMMADDSQLAAAQASKLKSDVLEEVRGFFSPELLNRFDETVVFQRLRPAHIAAIAQLLLQDTVDRAASSRGLHLTVAPPLMDAIVAEGHSDEYGARPLRQAIVRLVDDPLSDALLHRKFPPGTRLVLSLDPTRGHTRGAGVTVRTEQEEAEAMAAAAAAPRGRQLAHAHLAQHPSGVDGGILVSVGPGGGGDGGEEVLYGSDGTEGPVAAEQRQQAVVLSATYEEN